jgi:hypothetical protein
MQTCERCGADLDDSVAKCPYCGSETPAAARMAAAQWQAQAYAQATIADRQRQQAIADVAKSSMLAFVLSLLGLLACCTPLGIWSLVVALRAQAAAKLAGIAVPATAILAFILLALHVVCAGGFTVWYIHDTRVREARIAELQKVIDAHAAEEGLSHSLACALAEQRLLKEGFEDSSGVMIEDFSCDGRVSQDGDHAVLDPIRFHVSSSTAVTAKACLFRGARWSVARVAHGACSEPPHGAASASP